MRKIIMAALAGLGALLVPAAASAATIGITTADVNMRAGPSTEYPRIVVLPYGAEVEVYGCVRGYTWCDVGFYDERGWVSSRYIDIFYDDRRVYVPYEPRAQVPIITFDFGYWDRWYYHRPWYRDYRWERTYPRPDWYSERRRNDGVFYPPRREGGRNDRPRVERWDGRSGFERRSGDVIIEERSGERVIIEERRPRVGGQRLQQRRSADDVEVRRERRSKNGGNARAVERRGGDFVPPGQAKKGRGKPEPQGRARGQERRENRAAECVIINGRCELPRQR